MKHSLKYNFGGVVDAYKINNIPSDATQYVL